MNDFLVINGRTILYSELIYDLNKSHAVPKVINSPHQYEIFKNILLSLIVNKPITILDSDLTVEELDFLHLTKDDLQGSYECGNLFLRDKQDIVDAFLKNLDCQISLYSSGTTGIPKKITHTLKSLSKNVKRNESHKTDVWGFAYNPTHIAGLQVFLQAIFNCNKIVYLFRESKADIIRNLLSHEVTHISATPTFFRMLYDPKYTISSVKNISSGGEKFDESIASKLSKMFPNARFMNIYASTEFGTLFASRGEIFEIKTEFQNSVKIVNDELWVSIEHLGQSDSIQNVDGWYRTGDLVNVINTDPLQIKIIGRINDSVNVGGQKVFPTEVEEVINSISQVLDCKVYGIKNSVMGNILSCDVIRADESFTENDLHAILSGKLKDFKIPRIVNFVDSLTQTRTGKLSRR